MLKNIESIINLSQKRINFLHNVDNRGYYEGYKTYIKAIEEELEEAIQEIKEHNSVHLEDELGDIFWDYICLLHSLEENGYIDKEKVFQRCKKKFSERLKEEYVKDNWDKVKKQQKAELKKEHDLKYNK